MPRRLYRILKISNDVRQPRYFCDNNCLCVCVFSVCMSFFCSSACYGEKNSSSNVHCTILFICRQPRSLQMISKKMPCTAMEVKQSRESSTEYLFLLSYLHSYSCKVIFFPFRLVKLYQ